MLGQRESSDVAAACVSVENLPPDTLARCGERGLERSPSEVEPGSSSSTATYHLGHVTGWKHYLARLTTAAVGVDPGPDPGMS